MEGLQEAVQKKRIEEASKRELTKRAILSPKYYKQLRAGEVTHHKDSEGLPYKRPHIMQRFQDVMNRKGKK